MANILKRCSLLIIILTALAVSVPIQYSVRREVVVGLASEHAHSHAHEKGETRVHEEKQTEEGHTHTGEKEHGEEGHPASEIPLHTNLIANFSFEVGTRETVWGWGKKGEDRGALVFRDENRSYKGFASAAVSSQESDFVDAGWFTLLGAVPVAHDIVFRGYIRTEDLQGQAYLGLIIRGAEKGEMERKTLVAAYSDQAGGSNDWILGELRCYVPPEAQEVWLECGMYGKGRAWFDEVSLEVEERADYPLPGVNLLRNPSFEEGAKYWHLFLSGTDRPPSYGFLSDLSRGGSLLRIENPPGGGSASHTGFFQTLCGFSGKKGTLVLRGAVRSESLSGKAWVDVVAFRPSGSLGFMVTRELTGSTGWELLNAGVPLDGEAISLMVRLNVEGAGTFLVDNLEAVYLPSEPEE